MKVFKKTIMFALLGTFVAALGAMTSCCSSPDPVAPATPPVYVPPTK